MSCNIERPGPLDETQKYFPIGRRQSRQGGVLALKEMAPQASRSLHSVGEATVPA